MIYWFIYYIIAVFFIINYDIDDEGRPRLFGLLAKDIVNPVKWGSYVKGTVYSWFLKPHILEQVLIRQIECEDCVLAGKCLDCGCGMPAKTYDFNARCSKDKWGPVEKNKELWEQRKKDYKIKIVVSYV